MSADIHRLSASGEGIPEGGETVPPPVERSVYLDAYLAPFRRWLDRDTVTEIMVNCPGEVWIEDAASPGMQRIDTPEIDDRLVQRLAEQGRAGQPSRDQPRTPAARARPCPMVRGVQFCGPPAARKHWVMAIRRHRRAGPDRSMPMTPVRWWARVTSTCPIRRPSRIAYLRAAIRARRTILISGGNQHRQDHFPQRHAG